MILLAIDPSLTATGLVVLDVGAAGERVLEARCVRTKPDHRKRHLYQADQDGERVDAIARALRELLVAHHPDVIACEAPAGSRRAVSAKALGLAYGCVRGVLVGVNAPMPIMVQAHEARVAATSSKAASKRDVVAAMRARYGVPLDGPRVEREAIADALAVATAALGSPMVAGRRG